MKRSRDSVASRSSRAPAAEREPLWYKDAVFYEIRIGSFQDGDGDGTGDIRGLTSRLDYLQDLGVTVLWLLPFCPSPLRDDGYDIADYTDVHPDLGTLEDFRVFLREAHRRGLRVVTELVINHTSEQHPWFQRARRAPPDSRWRNWYVWSDSPDRYPDVRIIFKDFERSNWTWDPVANAYYWHRFYAHQPDLNFDNPEVQREVMRTLDFWFGLGVDGLRLDAIPYLFEREGTNCENLPETHVFLKALRAHVDARWQDRMLLAEANQWPEDAVTYFGDGDECHMSFHFPVMPRLFMSLHMEDRYPILDIMNQTPAIPENCQWALFLRNHDELTLEMVTDEERDYMYRVYAHDAKARINLGIRRRLAPLLGNDRRRIELLNALLFSLPGTPVLYYGDEIGMGDNFYLGDRNGVRTPMQWSSDRNAGFSTANAQRLFLPVIVDPEYHYESVNVEAQRNNPYSLLNWMKRLIALRRRTRAFGRGSLEFLHPANRKVLAFIREWEDERILVVANLSRFVEYVELDLSRFKNMVAVEMFAHSPFPPIGDLPYLLTLGPHSFYWFSIEPSESRGEAVESAGDQRPSLPSSASSLEMLLDRDRAALEAVLPEILRGRRWYGAKAARLRSAKCIDAIPIGRSQADTAALLLVRTELTAGGGEIYSVPLGLARGEAAHRLLLNAPHAILADVVHPTQEGEPRVLFDALEDPAFCAALLDGITRRKRWRGTAGELSAGTTKAFRALRGDPETPLPAHLLRAEQSNSSVVFGERLVLKLFRRLSVGTNPDLEIGRFLTERTESAHVPTTAGFLEYRALRSEPMTVAILQNWVENEGDAWHWTRDQLMRFYEDALFAHGDERPPLAGPSLLEISQGPPPPPVVLEMLGSFLETMRLLGRRIGELHVALASDREDPEFAPERFSTLYQRSLYQSMRNLSARSLDTLRSARDTLPAEAAEDALRLLRAEDRLGERFREVLREHLDALRIRCHGDLHLGQVLFTGSDFVIIDFEGEPARSLGERRLKRSPLADVAGMLRSFDYAARGSLLDFAREGTIRTEDVPTLEPWSTLWRSWVSSSFLRAYLRAVEGTGLVPTDRRQLETLLDVLLLEKAVYELGYELNNRPSWVTIPLRSILALIEPPEPGSEP
ncbi:maltose alpha-D-glucosyltransferase [Myxococcota bacterium]|nr:maltose alpha-D-glucosyltransferase [Myxococcota bacterium]